MSMKKGSETYEALVWRQQDRDAGVDLADGQGDEHRRMRLGELQVRGSGSWWGIASRDSEMQLTIESTQLDASRGTRARARTRGQIEEVLGFGRIY